MEKNILKRVASLALAVVMMLSVIAIIPETAKAADLGKTVTGSGKRPVTISDEQCYTATGQFYWIKFKAKKDGYVSVKASNASEISSYTRGEWTLYNSKKNKMLSPTVVYDTNRTDSYYFTDYYGVKKGTTYNLRVQALVGTKVTLTFKDVKESSGSKKSKAKSLKKGKEITGLMIAGDKSSDWYKVNLGSSAWLKLDLKLYISDKVRVEIKGPGIYDTRKIYDYRFNGEKIKLRWSGKVRKGTYYIQIKPETGTSTGAYKLKWLK